MTTAVPPSPNAGNQIDSVAKAKIPAAKIPANLLSIGAVDFGMIVDGSIVMVEPSAKERMCS